MEKMSDHYRIEEYTAETSLDLYIDDCVDVDQFLQYCKQCTNYNRVWSCPEFDFDPMEIWTSYKSLFILGRKVILDEELRLRVFSDEEREAFLKELLLEPKMDLDRTLLEMEHETPGSMALSGGSCLLCDPESCAKAEGLPCRHPEAMRYSIEALGGNVGRTVTRHLGEELLWMEKGRLPRYFIIVGGLLKN